MSTTGNDVNVTVKVFYGSSTSDHIGCVVGGGTFYTTATFTV